MSSTTGFWSLESGRAVAEAACTAEWRGGRRMRRKAVAAVTRSRNREAVERWDAGTEGWRRAAVRCGESPGVRSWPEMGGDAIAVADDAVVWLLWTCAWTGCDESCLFDRWASSVVDSGPWTSLLLPAHDFAAASI